MNASQPDAAESLARRTLSEVARHRSLFHSESDFQHEFAWHLRTHPNVGAVRLERPFRVAGRSMTFDVLVRVDAEWWIYELKYWKKRCTATLGGETFVLCDQGAQDGHRYDFWADVERIEAAVSAGVAHRGCVIALTNDPNFWSPPRSADTNDALFRLHDGATGGDRPMGWGPRTAPSSTTGRTRVLQLSRTYVARWTDYSVSSPKEPHDLRCLLVSVPARTP